MVLTHFTTKGVVHQAKFWCFIATVDDYERGVDVNIVRERFTESARKAESNRIVVWAGSGVGLMSKILAAKVSLNLETTSFALIFLDLGYCNGTTRRMPSASPKRGQAYLWISVISCPRKWPSMEAYLFLFLQRMQKCFTTESGESSRFKKPDHTCLITGYLYCGAKSWIMCNRDSTDQYLSIQVQKWK